MSKKSTNQEQAEALLVISKDRHYRTNGGHAVRILSVSERLTGDGLSKKDTFPVLAIVSLPEGDEALLYSAHGEYAFRASGPTLDLVEYDPWMDVEADRPVWIIEKNDKWKARHFRGYNPETRMVTVWAAGRTSYTSEPNGYLTFHVDEVSLTRPE